MALKPEWDPQEAIELLALCAYAEKDNPEPSIPDPNGSGWKCVFDSPVMGSFDNKWQLWRKGDNGPWGIALRGTVAESGSIIEDLVASMVKGRGSLRVGGVECEYKFAEDSEAGVHLGFALGTLLVLNDPDNGIKTKVEQLIQTASEIYVTGHSQGGAMATLLTSSLHYANILPADCSVKTYVYAQPKPGNVHYADDFEEQFCRTGMAFRVTNSLDWVPEVPFTLQFPQDIDRPNPLTVYASPSLLLTLITKCLDEARSHIETHTRARFQPQTVRVVQKTKPAAVAAAGGEPALLATPFEADFLPSLNYVNAGTDHPLDGKPCVEAECKDPLFEHHATTYYALLSVPDALGVPA